MSFDPRRFHVFLRPESGRSYGTVELQVACAGCMTVIRTVDEGVDLAALLHGAEQHCQGPHGDGEHPPAADTEHAAHCGPTRGGFRVCYCGCERCWDGVRCVCPGCRATKECSGHQGGGDE